jgi:hypothetical protein
MQLVSITPRVGAFPELRTFRCSVCNEAATIEALPERGRTSV